MPRTRAQENRAIRQEALRDQLANQGHVQHVVDIAEKLNEPKLESKDVQRLKAKADIHLALIKKYIPDMKAVEHEVEARIEKHLISEAPMTQEDWEEQYADSVESSDGATESTD